MTSTQCADLLRGFNWFALCCDFIIANCDQECHLRHARMVKNHYYSHERESEGAHYLHFLLIIVFLLMEFGVVVCVYWGGGDEADCREGSLSQGAGWAA